MPISLSPMMMRQIIMDHYENPQYKHAPEGDVSKYEQVHMDSANCIDDIIPQVIYNLSQLIITISNLIFSVICVNKLDITLLKHMNIKMQ